MLTLLDIAKANGSDAVAGLIDETSKAHPELTRGAARTIKGINYKTLVRIGLPTVGFRDANTGVASTKASHENRLVETFIMNPRWQSDKAVADRYEDGAAAYIALEASAHMEAGMQTLAKQFYYGRSSPGDAKGYPGLVDSVDAGMVVDAGGTTASTASSVWAVKFGAKDVIWVWGNNGALDPTEIDERDAEDADGNKFTAYHQELLAYPGVQVGSIRSIGRIRDLTEDAGKGLTDTLIADLLSKFEAGIVPDVLFATRRSLKQLRASRTATNATGAPAPIPTESFGIPIEVTDAILDTEALS
jgi:hypothetical protein